MEWIRKIIYDSTPLYLNSIGKKKSLLISTHLLPAQHKTPISVNALVDCGCTANGYADRSFIRKHNILVQRLPHPKRLLLADGKTSDTITEYFVTPLAMGHHQEPCFFYLTDLGKDSPLILSVPWLQLHNPSIDWPALKLTFTSDYCRHNCLPPNLPRETVIQAPPGHVLTAYPPLTLKPSSKLMTTNTIPSTTLPKKYQPPYVEDFPDEQASPSLNTAPILHIASSLTLGQPHYRTHNPRNATGPECQAIMVPTPIKSKPQPTEIIAGRR